MFETGLRIALTVFIVAPATAWIARHAAKERHDAAQGLTTFSVRMPSSIKMLFMVCAVIFELLMLGVFVLQGLTTGLWDGQLVWLGHALACVCFAVWGLLSMPRIDVDGDVLSARSMWGARRSATFAQIEKAEARMQAMSLTLFAGNAPFASCSLESVCAESLLERLEQEGIAITDAVESPLTKASLCWTAMKPLVIVFTGIAAACAFILVIMCFFGGVDANVLWIIPALFVLIGGVVPLFLLSLPLRGLRLLARQERELGFSFAQEMASRGGTGVPFEDRDWFVHISNVRIVALRRDFIQSISEVEDCDGGGRCVLTAKSGRRHKVLASATTLEDLRRWFARGPMRKSGMEAAKDAIRVSL